MISTHVSNIRKKDLLIYPSKYLWLEIPEEYSNINFSHLLDFIDKNTERGKDYKYGNAYSKIREVANQLLGVRAGSPMKLKVSKREIRTIRSTTISKIGRKTYLKIPYKISYIFKALCIIVEEIEDKYNITLPDELRNTVGMSYGVAFYNKFISTYDAYYGGLEERNREGIGYRLQVELNNDFHSENSVFDNILK